MSYLSKQTNLYVTLNYTKPYEESFQRNLDFSQPLVRWFIKEFCANLANFVTYSKVTNYFFGLIDAKLVRESFKSIFQFSHLLIRWLIKKLGANCPSFFPTFPQKKLGGKCRKLAGNVGKCRKLAGNVGKCREMSGNVGITCGGDLIN